MSAVEVDHLLDALLDIEGEWRGTLDVDDVVDLWLGLGHVANVLGDLVKAVADDASSRLLDREDPRAEYATQRGDVVHLAPGYAPERWRGRELTQRLGMALLDRDTGEVVEAVPVAVLLDVLPGVADDESTSSKWRTTGLRRHLDDWRRYRSRDDAPLTIRRGSPR